MVWKGVSVDGALGEHLRTDLMGPFQWATLAIVFVNVLSAIAGTMKDVCCSSSRKERKMCRCCVRFFGRFKSDGTFELGNVRKLLRNIFLQVEVMALILICTALQSRKDWAGYNIGILSIVVFERLVSTTYLHLLDAKESWQLKEHFLHGLKGCFCKCTGMRGLKEVYLSCLDSQDETFHLEQLAKVQATMLSFPAAFMVMGFSLREMSHKDTYALMYVAGFLSAVNMARMANYEDVLGLTERKIKWNTLLILFRATEIFFRLVVISACAAYVNYGVTFFLTVMFLLIKWIYALKLSQNQDSFPRWFKILLRLEFRASCSQFREEAYNYLCIGGSEEQTTEELPTEPQKERKESQKESKELQTESNESQKESNKGISCFEVSLNAFNKAFLLDFSFTARRSSFLSNQLFLIEMLIFTICIWARGYGILPKVSTTDAARYDEFDESVMYTVIFIWAMLPLTIFIVVGLVLYCTKIYDHKKYNSALNTEVGSLIKNKRWNMIHKLSLFDRIKHLTADQNYHIQKYSDEFRLSKLLQRKKDMSIPDIWKLKFGMKEIFNYQKMKWTAIQDYTESLLKEKGLEIEGGVNSIKFIKDTTKSERVLKPLQEFITPMCEVTLTYDIQYGPEEKKMTTDDVLDTFEKLILERDPSKQECHKFIHYDNFALMWKFMDQHDGKENVEKRNADTIRFTVNFAYKGVKEAKEDLKEHMKHIRSGNEQWFWGSNLDIKRIEISKNAIRLMINKITQKETQKKEDNDIAHRARFDRDGKERFKKLDEGYYDIWVARKGKQDAVIVVGSKVVITNENKTGIVRYIGKVPSYGAAVMYGVELDPGFNGTTNGTKNGTRFFDAPDNRGEFVTKDELEAIVPPVSYCRFGMEITGNWEEAKEALTKGLAEAYSLDEKKFNLEKSTCEKYNVVCNIKCYSPKEAQVINNKVSQTPADEVFDACRQALNASRRKVDCSPKSLDSPGIIPTVTDLFTLHPGDWSFDAWKLDKARRHQLKLQHLFSELLGIDSSAVKSKLTPQKNEEVKMEFFVTATEDKLKPMEDGSFLAKLISRIQDIAHIKQPEKKRGPSTSGNNEDEDKQAFRITKSSRFTGFEQNWQNQIRRSSIPIKISTRPVENVQVSSGEDIELFMKKMWEHGTYVRLYTLEHKQDKYVDTDFPVPENANANANAVQDPDENAGAPSGDAESVPVKQPADTNADSPAVAAGDAKSVAVAEANSNAEADGVVNHVPQQVEAVADVNVDAVEAPAKDAETPAGDAELVVVEQPAEADAAADANANVDAAEAAPENAEVNTDAVESPAGDVELVVVEQPAEVIQANADALAESLSAPSKSNAESQANSITNPSNVILEFGPVNLPSVDVEVHPGSKSQYHHIPRTADQRILACATVGLNFIEKAYKKQIPETTSEIDKFVERAVKKHLHYCQKLHFDDAKSVDPVKLSNEYEHLTVIPPEEISAAVIDTGCMGGEGANSLSSLKIIMDIHPAYLFVYNDSNYEAGEINGLFKMSDKILMFDPHYRDPQSGLRSDCDNGVAVLLEFESVDTLISHLRNLTSLDPAFTWTVHPVLYSLSPVTLEGWQERLLERASMLPVIKSPPISSPVVPSNAEILPSVAQSVVGSDSTAPVQSAPDSEQPVFGSDSTASNIISPSNPPQQNPISDSNIDVDLVPPQAKKAEQSKKMEGLKVRNFRLKEHRMSKGLPKLGHSYTERKVIFSEGDHVIHVRSKKPKEGSSDDESIEERQMVITQVLSNGMYKVLPKDHDGTSQSQKEPKDFKEEEEKPEPPESPAPQIEEMLNAKQTLPKQSEASTDVKQDEEEEEVKGEDLRAVFLSEKNLNVLHILVLPGIKVESNEATEGGNQGFFETEEGNYKWEEYNDQILGIGLKADELLKFEAGQEVEILSKLNTPNGPNEINKDGILKNTKKRYKDLWKEYRADRAKQNDEEEWLVKVMSIVSEYQATEESECNQEEELTEELTESFCISLCRSLCTFCQLFMWPCVYIDLCMFCQTQSICCQGGDLKSVELVLGNEADDQKRRPKAAECDEYDPDPPRTDCSLPDKGPGPMRSEKNQSMFEIQWRINEKRFRAHEASIGQLFATIFGVKKAKASIKCDGIRRALTSDDRYAIKVTIETNDDFKASDVKDTARKAFAKKLNEKLIKLLPIDRDESITDCKKLLFKLSIKGEFSAHHKSMKESFADIFGVDEAKVECDFQRCDEIWEYLAEGLAEDRRRIEVSIETDEDLKKSEDFEINCNYFAERLESDLIKWFKDSALEILVDSKIAPPIDPEKVQTGDIFLYSQRSFYSNCKQLLLEGGPYTHCGVILVEGDREEDVYVIEDNAPHNQTRYNDLKSNYLKKTRITEYFSKVMKDSLYGDCISIRRVKRPRSANGNPEDLGTGDRRFRNKEQALLAFCETWESDIDKDCFCYNRSAPFVRAWLKHMWPAEVDEFLPKNCVASDFGYHRACVCSKQCAPQFFQLPICFCVCLCFSYIPSRFYRDCKGTAFKTARKNVFGDLYTIDYVSIVKWLEVKNLASIENEGLCDKPSLIYESFETDNDIKRPPSFFINSRCTVTQSITERKGLGQNALKEIFFRDPKFIHKHGPENFKIKRTFNRNEKLNLLVDDNNMIRKRTSKVQVGWIIETVKINHRDRSRKGCRSKLEKVADGRKVDDGLSRYFALKPSVDEIEITFREGKKLYAKRGDAGRLLGPPTLVGKTYYYPIMLEELEKTQDYKRTPLHTVALAEHEFVMAADLLAYARPKCGNFTINYIFIFILTIMTAGIGLFAYTKIQEKRKRIESGMYEKKKKMSCLGNYFKDRLEYYLLLFSYIFGLIVLVTVNDTIGHFEGGLTRLVIGSFYALMIFFSFEKIFCCGADLEKEEELNVDLSDVLKIQQYLNDFRIEAINDIAQDVAIPRFHVGDRITHFRSGEIKENVSRPYNNRLKNSYCPYNCFSFNGCCSCSNPFSFCFQSKSTQGNADMENPAVQMTNLSEESRTEPHKEPSSESALKPSKSKWHDQSTYESIEFHLKKKRISHELSKEEMIAEFMAVCQKAMKKILGQNRQIQFTQAPSCLHDYSSFSLFGFEPNTSYRFYVDMPDCNKPGELIFVLDFSNTFKKANAFGKKAKKLITEIEYIWEILRGEETVGVWCGKQCVKKCPCTKVETSSSNQRWKALKSMNELDMWLPSATENRPIQIKIKRQCCNPYKAFFKLGFGYCGIATNEVDRITEIDAVKLPFVMFISIFTSVFFYYMWDAFQNLKNAQDYYFFVGAALSTALAVSRAAKYMIQSVITVDKSVMENIVPYSGFVTQKIRTVSQDVRELTTNSCYSDTGEKQYEQETTLRRRHRKGS